MARSAVRWHAERAEDVVRRLATDPVRGLVAAEAARRLNDTLRAQPELSLCTALCMRLDPRRGGRT
jgi:hypothetical protein